jgi:hypothetical protein
MRLNLLLAALAFALLALALAGWVLQSIRRTVRAV